MLHENLYEIIALIVVFTAIIIYFLMKKFAYEEEEIISNIKYSKKKKFYDTDVEIIEEFTPNDEDNKDDDEEPYLLRASDQGSFGDLGSNPFDEKVIVKVKKKETQKKKSRQKVTVPPHGDIKKENFKEFAGVKLLVAEDNIINQKVINGLLQNSGIKITMADDGQIALDILKKDSDYDMILMDVHMPNIDGFKATRIIRENPNYDHIVVVALSGDTAADDIKNMVHSGMEEQLEKPLRMKALYDVLYAYTKLDINESESIQAMSTKELNADKGLDVCGGDDEFYKDILTEFINNYENSSKKLSDLLENEEVELADAMLLDFIGIAANIGANNIKEIALELKETIKDTKEKSYITLLENYEQHLQVLLKDIKEYI